MGQLIGFGHVYDANLVRRVARVRTVEGNDELPAVIIIVEAAVLFIAYKLHLLNVEAFGIERHLRLRIEVGAQREHGCAQQVLLFIVEAYIEPSIDDIGEDGGGGLQRGIGRQPGRHHDARGRRSRDGG